MKRLLMFLFAFVCCIAVSLPNMAEAAAQGYWVLTESALKDRVTTDGEYWKGTVSASANGATFSCRGAQNEYEKTSVTWTNPAERVYEGEVVSMQLSAKVEALTNRPDSHVGLYARIDQPDMDMQMITGGAVRLTDDKGNYSCETWTESMSLTVSASLGVGSAPGEIKTVYVECSGSGGWAQCRYVYKWIVKSELVIQDSGARFNSLSGTVEVASEENYQLGIWGFAKPDTMLNAGDHVRTGEESSCILSFPDMSSVILPEGSHIILNAPPRGNDSKLELVWGRIKANIKRMMKDGTMEIEMSQGVCGIKGTTFVCEDDGKTSTLKVFEGTVEFTSKATGKSVMVKAGQKASADQNGLSKVTSLDTEKEQKTWKSLEKTLSADEKGASASKSKTDKNKGMDPVLLSLLVIAPVVIAAVLIILHRRKKAAGKKS